MRATASSSPRVSSPENATAHASFFSLDAKRSLRARQNIDVTFSIPDLIATVGIAAVVAAWTTIAAHAFSPLALLSCEAAFFAFYVVGSLFAGWRALAAGVLFDLPLRLLLGYVVVNTALLALAWLSPFGIVVNFAFLFALALASFIAARARSEKRARAIDLWVVALCLAATSLWCQDSIYPTSEQGALFLAKPWIDGFYHAVHVRIFGASHGAQTIEDFRLVGLPARPYHYGMYLTAGLIKQASGIDSYTAFAAVLAPVGVFFTGLAAYAFIGSLWGAWPGFTACAALLLLPDGAEQGMRNPFMSYHWLTQISPSASYGLAVLAVAWLFVMRGCAQGRRLQVIAGWVISGALIFYKLHFFIAGALLLLLVPALFFRGNFSLRQRVSWIVAASVVYGAALWFAQRVPGVPLIRFDGSGTGEILRLIQSFAMPGKLRDYFARHMGAESPLASNLFFGAPYVLVSVLGLFLPTLALFAIRLRKRASLLDLLFPILLIVNFLFMFFGLALDFDSSTPDELQHRPLMVLYFFVVIWLGGALGKTLLEAQRFAHITRPIVVGLSIVLLAVPAFLGAGVHRMWAMSRISPVRAPLDLVRVAKYMRAHGNPEDVFQDSQFDRTYLIAAFAERRTYVAHTLTRMPYRSDVTEARTNAVDSLMSQRRAGAVRAKAKALGLRWFLLEPGDRIDWPAEIADHPEFQAGQFKLYRF